MPAPPPFSPPSTCNCMQARRRSCRFREQVNATASRHFRAPAIVGAGFKPAPTPSPRWVRAEIFGVAGGLLPLRVAAPLEMAARHVGPIAHAKEERAGGAVAVFMQLARWMHHERARRHVDRLARRAHLSAALEAEINLGGLRMAVIGTDLARLPARHGDVTLSDLAEDLLHVMLGVPLLLFFQIEGLHAFTSAVDELKTLPSYARATRRISSLTSSASSSLQTASITRSASHLGHPVAARSRSFCAISTSVIG